MHPIKTFGLSNLLKIVGNLFIFVALILSAEATSSILKSAEKMDFDSVISNLLAAVTAIILLYIIAYMSKRFGEILSKKDEQKYRFEIYRLFMNQTTATVNKVGLSAIKSRFAVDLTTLVAFYGETVPQFFAGMISCVVCYIYISRINMFIIFILILISLIQIIPPIIVKKYIHEDYRKANLVGQKWMRLIFEAYNGLSHIKLFNLKNWYKKKLDKINDESILVYTDKFRHVQKEEMLNRTASSFILYGTYSIIGIFIFMNIIRLEQAAKIIILSSYFFSASKTVFQSMPNFFVLPIAKNRIFELITENPIKNRTAENLLSIAFATMLNMEASNISFSYDNKKIIDNMSLKIAKGSKTALIGPNGSGKSTLIKLLLGEMDVDSGDITVFGIKIKDAKHRIFDLVSYLPQIDSEINISSEEYLYMVNDSDINKNEFDEVLRGLGFDINLKGFNSFSSLSGGERKKLLLAYALARKPDFLILDEPTNSLDVESKQFLIDYLCKTDKTLMIISHDDAVTKCCDVIINLEKVG